MQDTRQEAGAALVANLDDLPTGSVRMVRVDGRRLCLVRTQDGVFALDNACPHEGYGLVQGDLDGGVLTCAWHNWKFRVSDGACLVGQEDVNTHEVGVDELGGVRVRLRHQDPAANRARLLASLERGIERAYVGQISRDVVRLLRASADPGELVWRAVAHGAPRAEFGWGHAVASATDALAMTSLYDGDQRALPVVQAIAGIAEQERHRPPRPLPDPASTLPPDPAAAFRRAVEAEDTALAQSLVRAGIESGLGEEHLRRWFTLAVSDHHLAYGHGAIYVQKAFELLDLLGWGRADTVLPHLVPTLVVATREDRLPYMRPFMQGLAQLDLDQLAGIEPAAGWSDDGTLRQALLGADRTAPLNAAVSALRAGAGVDGLLDTIVDAVSERMLRYDTAGEQELSDDFGWLDMTHGITYANAVRSHSRALPGPDTLRLALFVVFLAHWTGRHEWHTAVAAPPEPRLTGDLPSACAARDAEAAVGAVLAQPLAAAAVDLQRTALLDHLSTFILHAHGIKTTRAAAQEAAATGSPSPVAATARFLAAPKLERFVAGNVTRSIDLVAGRAPRR